MERRVGLRTLTVFLVLSTSLPHATLVVYMRPPRHLAETLFKGQNGKMKFLKNVLTDSCFVWYTNGVPKAGCSAAR
jgi:hypothetical protein